MHNFKKVLIITMAMIAILVVAGATVAFSQAGGTAAQSPARQDQAGQDPAQPPLGQRLADRVRRARRFFQAHELMDVALAGELNITVDELVTARQAARLTVIQQTAGEGLISEERAELMLAQAALQGYLDRDELIAQVFNITVAELQAARAEGKNIRQIAAELSLNGPTVRENMKAVREATILQAAAGGVITDDQAELLLNTPRRFREAPRPLPRPAG